jgi:hypothetical protein
VADLPSHKPHHALCKRRRKSTGVGLRIEHVFIDGEIAVWANRHRRLVDKQQLHRSRGGRLDSLTMCDRLADDDRARSTLPARLRCRVDGGRSADFLRENSCATCTHNGEPRRKAQSIKCATHERLHRPRLQPNQCVPDQEFNPDRAINKWLITDCKRLIDGVAE